MHREHRKGGGGGYLFQNTLEIASNTDSLESSQKDSCFSLIFKMTPSAIPFSLDQWLGFPSPLFSVDSNMNPDKQKITSADRSIVCHWQRLILLTREANHPRCRFLCKIRIILCVIIVHILCKFHTYVHLVPLPRLLKLKPSV